MYEMLHSERFESQPIYGVVFIAQVIGGKTRFGARLALPIRKYENTFEIWDHEWDRETGPYTLHLNPIYKEMFDYPETQAWIENEVEPWVLATKMTHLHKQLGYTSKIVEDMRKELDKLEQRV